MKSPLKYHGGKAYSADWIVSHFPPHVHYVEPYAGGLSVLLRKEPSGSEVVNDLDRRLMNFWRVLQHPEWFREFQRQVEAIPFSQAAWEEAAIAAPGPVGEAVAFFVRARQSRQGMGKCFATLSRNRTRRGMNEQASAWWNAVDGLEDIYWRLRRVVLLSADALDVIKQQDGPETLFYLDPPYVHETRTVTSAYAHELSVEEHTALLDVLTEIEGRFVLSGYRNALYDAWAQANAWVRADKEFACHSSGSATKEMRVESLWFNFVPKA